MLLGVLLIKTLHSKCISQIRLDINKIKKQDQNRVEEDEERKKKKRKKLTTKQSVEQSAEIQERLGGVGVRVCGVKSREMRWVSVRELMSLCEIY